MVENPCSRGFHHRPRDTLFVFIVGSLKSDVSSFVKGCRFTVCALHAMCVILPRRHRRRHCTTTAVASAGVLYLPLFRTISHYQRRVSMLVIFSGLKVLEFATLVRHLDVEPDLSLSYLGYSYDLSAHCDRQNS